MSRSAPTHQGPASTQTLLLINPRAGSGSGREIGRQVAVQLTAAGLRSQTVLTDPSNHHERARQLIATGQLNSVIVVGGDGTVQLGVNLVAGTPVPLGIVPAGTGNDNARELGLPTEAAPAAALAAQALTHGQRRQVDAVRWRTPQGEGGWYLSVLSAGFDSLVSERAEQWRRIPGRWRYDVAMVRELPRFRAQPYRLELDGNMLLTEAIVVCVGNGPAYGGGLRIASGAQMDDGLLDVVVIGKVNLLTLARLYPKLSQGGHLGHPAVTVHRARTVQISVEPMSAGGGQNGVGQNGTVRMNSASALAYADGERLAPLPVTCAVQPNALTLLAPPLAGRSGRSEEVN